MSVKTYALLKVISEHLKGRWTVSERELKEKVMVISDTRYAKIAIKETVIEQVIVFEYSRVATDEWWCQDVENK